MYYGFGNSKYEEFTKVIFLDVDGVLNDGQPHNEPELAVEESKVQRLRKIVDATGAKIILSSSWRYAYQKFNEEPDIIPEYKRPVLAWFVELFKKYDMPIAGWTDDMETGSLARPLEIRHWLMDKAYLESFVILDDDDFWDWHWLAPHCVLTRKEIPNERRPEFPERVRGLDDDHVEQAIAILNARDEIKYKRKHKFDR